MAKKAPKTKEERNKRKIERNLSDIRSVAATPEGRRFIWNILSRAGVFQPNGHEEAIGMAKIEGRRSNGIDLLKDIMTAKASLFGKMQQEHASEAKRELCEIETENEESDPLSL